MEKRLSTLLDAQSRRSLTLLMVLIGISLGSEFILQWQLLSNLFGVHSQNIFGLFEVDLSGIAAVNVMVLSTLMSYGLYDRLRHAIYFNVAPPEFTNMHKFLVLGPFIYSFSAGITNAYYIVHKAELSGYPLPLMMCIMIFVLLALLSSLMLFASSVLSVVVLIVLPHRTKKREEQKLINERTALNAEKKGIEEQKWFISMMPLKIRY